MLMRVQFSETYSETTQSGYFSFLHIGRNVILAHITVSIWPMLIILPFNSALTTRIEIYGLHCGGEKGDEKKFNEREEGDAAEDGDRDG